MDLEQYIPFKEKKFRPGQKEAIEDILNSIYNGNKFTILNAPVGIGKSVIAYVIAKIFEEHNKYTYMCTGTKILQSQYINDFTDVKTIKGRMNFNCASESLFDCSKGMCQSHANYKCDFKPILKDQWEYDNNVLPTCPIEINNKTQYYGDYDFDEMFLSGMCSYWKQKLIGIMSPITMLNYDYLISDVRFAKHLPYRKLLVCDEAHNIEQILMRQLEVSFSPSNVKKETGYQIEETNNIQLWIEQFEEISDLYKQLIKETNGKRKMKMQEKYEKFSILHILLEEDPTNWVYIQEKQYGHLFYVFKPIIVSQYSDYIFNIAENVLLMTGTVLKQDLFARDLGICDFEYIEIPSIIQPQNRPIVKSYVGSMSRSSIDSTMPKMIEKIKILADVHSNEKGVLHTFTYNIAKRFQDAFADDDRYMFHNSKNKELVFNAFKADNTNKILVSPVAFEGVDFPYDQARWQCICKEPFPNIKDPQISVRDAVDYGWIFRQRCLILSQMYGRTNRAPDDYSVTYLLDSRIQSLLGASTLVTDYFLEALDGFRYNDKMVLCDDAYEKLTKDNSRKTHEFDREVEISILKDIEDGYDTLSSLRREYKKFPSDAYKYIIPGVERLLKHKAIKFI